MSETTIIFCDDDKLRHCVDMIKVCMTYYHQQHQRRTSYHLRVSLCVAGSARRCAPGLHQGWHGLPLHRLCGSQSGGGAHWGGLRGEGGVMW